VAVKSGGTTSQREKHAPSRKAKQVQYQKPPSIGLDHGTLLTSKVLIKGIMIITSVLYLFIYLAPLFFQKFFSNPLTLKRREIVQEAL
jgi:hypothetical protein